MNIEKKITISLSEDDIKNLVADYLVKEGYKVTSENVKLSVKTRWEGYGMAEHQVPYFEECTVTTIV